MRTLKNSYVIFAFVVIFYLISVVKWQSGDVKIRENNQCQNEFSQQENNLDDVKKTVTTHNTRKYKYSWGSMTYIVILDTGMVCCVLSMPIS